MLEKPMNMETEAPPVAPAAAPPQEGADEPQGIDGIIARVDSYIAKPEMITPDTLMELRQELEDLKSFLEPESEADVPSGAPEGGLAGIIGGR